MSKTPPPFKLVLEPMSVDTVIAMEELLKKARNAQVIGFAFAAMYRERRYTVNVTGEARRNPTFGRGMVHALDDYLSELLRKKK